MRLPFQIVEVGIGRAKDLRGKFELRIGRVEIDEAVRIAIGQRTQQDCIDQAKDSRACADAEREREYRGEGEARRATQRTHAVVDILHDALDEWQGMPVANCLASLLRATETNERLAPS